MLINYFWWWYIFDAKHFINLLTHFLRRLKRHDVKTTVFSPSNSHDARISLVCFWVIGGTYSSSISDLTQLIWHPRQVSAKIHKERKQKCKLWCKCLNWLTLQSIKRNAQVILMRFLMTPSKIHSFIIILFTKSNIRHDQDC